jgi:hypothetical protein
LARRVLCRRGTPWEASLHLLRRQADVFQQVGVEFAQGGKLPGARMWRANAGKSEFPDSVQDRSEGGHGGRSFGRHDKDGLPPPINEAFVTYAKHEKIFG